MTSWPEVAQPGSVLDVADVALLRTHGETAGAVVLDRVEAFLSRFVAYPSEAARVASVLWAAHTHALDAFDHTPRLAYLSPEPGSGKTRALEVLELLTPNAVHAVNATPAYLFRKIADQDNRPTILFDEADTVFGPRSAKDNEDLRGVLNAGHARGAIAGRCVVKGKTVETEDLPAFAAVALAGLGDLPDTVMTRAVVVRMRRRAPHEQIEPYRRRVHGAEGEDLRALLAEWVGSVRDQLEGAWPDLPPGIVDRAADVWEPLLAVAVAAGGAWPRRASTAAVQMVTEANDRPATLGVRLLGDLRQVFDDHGADVLPTEVILAALLDLDESPWGNLRGHPLDARGLARRLREYQRGDDNSEPIKAVTIRVGDKTPKGYRREDLHDAWTRYLPASASLRNSATSATAATAEPDRQATPAPPSPSKEADASGAATCVLCGNELLFIVEGRDTCARCEHNARVAS